MSTKSAGKAKDGSMGEGGRGDICFLKKCAVMFFPVKVRHQVFPSSKSAPSSFYFPQSAPSGCL